MATTAAKTHPIRDFTVRTLVTGIIMAIVLFILLFAFSAAG